MELRAFASWGQLLGVMTVVRAAMNAGLDLVEVNPMAKPPVCKLLDLSKYRHGTVDAAHEEEDDDD